VSDNVIGEEEVTLEIARRAMDAAIEGEEDVFGGLLMLISSRHPYYLDHTLWYWCLRYVDHATNGIPPNEIDSSTEFQGLSFINSSDSVERSADDPGISKEIIWAGRMVTAATLNDIDQYNALIYALPTDEKEILEHVGTLGLCVAETIRSTHRGFACTPTPGESG
jgi:hypothetical protein